MSPHIAPARQQSRRQHPAEIDARRHSQSVTGAVEGGQAKLHQIHLIHVGQVLGPPLQESAGVGHVAHPDLHITAKPPVAGQAVAKAGKELVAIVDLGKLAAQGKAFRTVLDEIVIVVAANEDRCAFLQIGQIDPQAKTGPGLGAVELGVFVRGFEAAVRAARGVKVAVFAKQAVEPERGAANRLLDLFARPIHRLGVDRLSMVRVQLLARARAMVARHIGLILPVFGRDQGRVSGRIGARHGRVVDGPVPAVIDQFLQCFGLALRGGLVRGRVFTAGLLRRRRFDVGSHGRLCRGLRRQCRSRQRHGHQQHGTQSAQGFGQTDGRSRNTDRHRAC